MTQGRPWAYSAFRVAVKAGSRLSPHFLRLTFAGDDLRHFAPWGADQRIKLVLPLPDGGIADFGLLADPTPHPSDWYAHWRAMPESERNVLRTYTPAAIRPSAGEIDVDFFLHEPAGPASAWALGATPGEELVITGPDIRAGWTGYGLHWTPGDARRHLLIADETAYPAVRNILGMLPDGSHADVFLQRVDVADDLVSQHAPGSARVHIVTESSESSDGLEAAVRRWGEETGAEVATDAAFSAWIAGESGATTRLRRYLTSSLGVPKERVAFLGYWRLGGALVG